MTKAKDHTQVLLEAIAAEFAALPEVEAVVLAGSKGGRHSDESSDIDLCVYAETEPPEAWRAKLARKLGERASIGNRFWETGDEWISKQTGNIVDIMYRSPDWITEQIDRALVRHQASVGYSTCFVHNVLHSRAYHDPHGWYAALQARTAQPYPDGLRRTIVAKNHPILRGIHSSYLHQIELALARNDHVSVNHRVAALLASYFDILFAVNRLPHPGEKRLLVYAMSECPKRPADLQEQLDGVLQAVSPVGNAHLPERVNELLDGLDSLLQAEGLQIPAPP
ncbi:MAG: DUF4037 domain-containing protein [Gammaproteobacteria bacterium]|nr:DUF4037 domain-containing protein [Gammaproteobacteria bacterium]MBU1775240.1 DUF4037 domain-containing protein [Gammaproteobacteria bacterium]MBU1968639.1 DUF4037 domain-containing protein [Gammaproteobacteria bacterium]